MIEFLNRGHVSSLLFENTCLETIHQGLSALAYAVEKGNWGKFAGLKGWAS